MCELYQTYILVCIWQLTCNCVVSSACQLQPHILPLPFADIITSYKNWMQLPQTYISILNEQMPYFHVFQFKFRYEKSRWSDELLRKNVLVFHSSFFCCQLCLNCKKHILLCRDYTYHMYLIYFIMLKIECRIFIMGWPSSERVNIGFALTKKSTWSKFRRQ